MDFQISDEQNQILDSVNRFLERQLPTDEQIRRDQQFDPPYHLLKVMAEGGFLALISVQINLFRSNFHKSR